MTKIRGQLILHDKLRGLDVQDKKLIIKLSDGLKFDPNGAITLDSTILRSDGTQNITGQKIFFVAPLLEGDVLTDKSIIHKQYLEEYIDRYFWGKPLFTGNQCVDGHDGGIIPAAVLTILDSTNICQHNNSIIRIEYKYDNTTYYFDIILTLTPTASNHVNISDIPTEEELAVRIVNTIQNYSNDNDIAANFNEKSFAVDNHVFILYNEVIELQSLRILVSTSIDEYCSIENAIDHNLGKKHIHLTKFVSYPLQLEGKAILWNSYHLKWNIYGVDHIADENTPGVIKVGDGLAVDSNDRLKIDTGETLTLNGTSPHKKLEINPNIAGDGLNFENNQLNVNIGKGLEIDDDKLQIKIAGDLFFSEEGELTYFDVNAKVQVETHSITYNDLQRGYFELSHKPVNPKGVMIYGLGGIPHLNKKSNPNIIADYDVCTEEGYEKRIYIKNGKTIGNYTSSGLSEEYQEDDTIVIYYHFED